MEGSFQSLASSYAQVPWPTRLGGRCIDGLNVLPRDQQSELIFQGWLRRPPGYSALACESLSVRRLRGVAGRFLERLVVSGTFTSISDSNSSNESTSRLSQRKFSTSMMSVSDATCKYRIRRPSDETASPGSSGGSGFSSVAIRDTLWSVKL